MTEGAAPSPWRGIFSIPVTPFDEDGMLDTDSLRRELDFCVEAGAHGIVYPVVASEFLTLSEEERLAVLPLATRQVRGRTPVMLGVSGVSTQAAVRYAQVARDAGADAVIAMPPYVTRYAEDDVLRYFEAIARAAQVPVCIQNAPLASLSQAQVLRLVREVEHVHLVKEEVPPGHHNIARLAAVGESRVWSIFGGGGGANLIDELRRGAGGNMPACQYTDVHVAVFALWEAGDERGARALHARLLPGMQRERLNGVAASKEVLVRRGVIRTGRTRGAGVSLDAHDRAEFDVLWPELEQVFSWRRHD